MVLTLCKDIVDVIFCFVVLVLLVSFSAGIEPESVAKAIKEYEDSWGGGAVCSWKR